MQLRDKNKVNSIEVSVIGFKNDKRIVKIIQKCCNGWIIPITSAEIGFIQGECLSYKGIKYYTLKWHKIFKWPRPGFPTKSVEFKYK